ncbi:hypothetical protein NDU88_005581 [Pleurodeles waltl]|uniref:Uncharacterized protein n=1 Tax=Pleurodeles waltl TaxID=8319 RepID=A0AAV7TW03_PLEWA|nr:hypothetical protein NDU88_005581 [Pleurodeles waltl]
MVEFRVTKEGKWTLRAAPETKEEKVEKNATTGEKAEKNTATAERKAEKNATSGEKRRREGPKDGRRAGNTPGPPVATRDNGGSGGSTPEPGHALGRAWPQQVYSPYPWVTGIAVLPDPEVLGVGTNRGGRPGDEEREKGLFAETKEEKGEKNAMTGEKAEKNTAMAERMAEKNAMSGEKRRR